VTHLRKMMLEKLQRRNHSALPHATTSALRKDLHLYALPTERRSARVQVLNPNGAAGKILKRRMLSFPDVFEKAIGSWIGRVPK
jgi:hypothetical protein